ncbi:TRAP transporter small permease [Psychrosphaera aquimarina]|uniref:TRAP transporter small permease protein n=1 Tax=Psychrosphaera aquimarina TaxID=2044854 RepID=A0ABU3R2W7_9GAMM|nr:TRAP transporter small permease [Psychrosphaera aquimarina]MDU0113765.1 TRAP transporter small permease [Psychrosphaera aquimarina]
MKFINDLVNRLDSVLRVVLAVMMAALVVDVTWQVLTRFILPQPSSFTEEVARFLLIWVSLLGGAYAYREQSHLGFNLLVRNMSLNNQVRIHKFSCVLVAIFAILVLIIGGSNLVYLTWLLGQHSPVLDVPMAFIYTVIPASGLLFLLYSLHFFLQNPLTNTSPESNDE